MNYYCPPKWYLKLVLDSTAEPVSTSDIKRHVNLPTSFIGDDPWISDAVTAARKLIEQYIPGGRAFINQTWDLVLDQFPRGDDRIEFPLPPFQSISSITYYDANNSSTTLATSDYVTHAPHSLPGYIKPAYNKVWPSSSQREDAVTIRFVAGYGSSASSVPMNVRHALKMTVAHWYENREQVVIMPGAATVNVPLGVEALLAANSYGFYG
jgi:uncharacterized phiE125 gp8 family phage protein